MLHLYVHRLSSTLNVFIYWYFALRIRKYLAVQWVLNIVRNNTVSLREMIEMLRHQHKETEKKKYTEELSFKITTGLPDERRGTPGDSGPRGGRRGLPRKAGARPHNSYMSRTYCWSDEMRNTCINRSCNTHSVDRTGSNTSGNTREPSRTVASAISPYSQSQPHRRISPAKGRLPTLLLPVFILPKRRNNSGTLSGSVFITSMRLASLHFLLQFLYSLFSLLHSYLSF